MNTTIVIPVEFANQNINFRYLVNGRGLIAGMFMLPGGTPWQPAAYSKPDSFHERAVTVGEDEWKLPRHAHAAQRQRAVSGGGAGAWLRAQRPR